MMNLSGIALVIVCVTLLLCIIILAHELSAICDELNGIRCELIAFSSAPINASLAKLCRELRDISWGLENIGAHIDTLGDVLGDGDTNGN